MIKEKEITIQELNDIYSKYGDLDIKIDTPYGYHDIEWCGITEKNADVYRCELTNGLVIEGADKHRLKLDNGDFITLDEIKVDDIIQTRYENSKVKDIKLLEVKDTLYDVQVSKVHQYYSNNIVSHNTVLTVDLLLFLFFNTTTKTNKAEEVFNRFRNKNEVIVKGEITIDGEDYIILREVKRKLKKNGQDYTVSTSLEFFKKLADGSLQNFTGEQRRETEEFIKKSIGTMDDFLMTILTTATNLEDLIESKPTARGQVLSRFLGLDSLKLKEDVAKEITSDYSKRMISNIYNVEKLKESIELSKDGIHNENKNILTYLDELTDVNSRIEKGQSYRDELIKKKHTGLDDELLRINPDKLEEQINSYNSKIRDIKKSIQDTLVVEPKEFYHEDKHDEVKEKLSDAKLKMLNMQSKVADINKELESFKGGQKCQYCSINLETSDYSDRKRKEVESLNLSIVETTTIVNTLTNDEKSFTDLKKEFDIYEKNKLIKEKYEIQLESYGLMKKEVETKLKNFKESQIKVEENNKIDEIIIKADLRLESLVFERDKVNEKISHSKNNIKNMETKIKENEGFILQIKNEEEKLRLYKIYLELFGKKGIAKMIMRSMVPTINSELHRLLVDSAEFKLEIRINDKDEVEFIMIDNKTGIEKLMSSGSGYEKTIASLGLRAILTKVSSLPAPNIIVLDEVTGKISNDNLEMVGEFFYKIKEYFEKIIIISHNPLVSNWGNNIIKIEKTDNISKVIQ